MPGPWASSAGSCGGEPGIDSGLQDSVEGGEAERRRRGRKKEWKSGPSFFEEEGELGND